MKLQTVSDELKAPLDEKEASPNGDSLQNPSPMKASPLFDSEEDIGLSRFECQSCGYIYDPKEGLKKFNIQKGTSFLDLEQSKFRCPVCRSGVAAYKDIGPKFQPSGGIEENLGYGFGFNNLPPGQKNILIFGGFAFAAAIFLSLYSLH